MKTRVIGKNITRTYRVKENSHEEKTEDGVKVIFDKKPELAWDTKEEEAEICVYEGEPRHNFAIDMRLGHYINVEDEEVFVKKESFISNRSEWKQYVDKEVTVTEVNKDEAEFHLAELIRGYNRQVIEGDEELFAYCKLHKLYPAETDADELKKLVKSHTNPAKCTVIDADKLAMERSIVLNTPISGSGTSWSYNPETNTFKF